MVGLMTTDVGGVIAFVCVGYIIVMLVLSTPIHAVMGKWDWGDFYLLWFAAIAVVGAITQFDNGKWVWGVIFSLLVLWFLGWVTKRGVE